VPSRVDLQHHTDGDTAFLGHTSDGKPAFGGTLETT
jgi:hypothetical protein